MPKIIEIKGKDDKEIERKADAIVKKTYGPMVLKVYDRDAGSTIWCDSVTREYLAELLIYDKGYLAIWYSKREAEKRRQEALSEAEKL